MANKIVPIFSGPLTANGLKQWLGACEDGFDNYEDTHEAKILAPKTRIRMTGTALAETQMADWWAMGWKEFLELKGWEIFVEKLKDHFMPVDWKTDALELFYQCNQGKRDFRSFAADLAQALNALPYGTISTTTHKHHLLFFCNPHLYLRMRAIPSFSVDDTIQTPNKLIALMAAQWDCLVADSSRSIRSTLATSSGTLAPSIPLTLGSTSPAPVSKFIPLTDQEKSDLTAARGCWNCRFKPGDPSWTPHQRQQCPGNPDIGARPGREYVSTPTVIAGAAFTTSSFEPDVTESEPESEMDPSGYDFYLDNDTD